MMKQTKSAARFVTIAFLGLTVTSATALFSVANAGIHNSSTGPVCQGASSCNFLEANCKGKYVDATDNDGKVYGKCYPKSKAASAAKFKAKSPRPQKGLRVAK